MFLESVEAANFRNLNGRLKGESGLNILIGKNGQGKTNWLEAISVLSTTRSFRTPRLQEAVRFGAEMAIVRGTVQRAEGLHRELRAVIQGGNKSFFVNDKRESVQNYVNHLHSIVFNADELEVVRGLPDVRRRFLDRAIASIHPPYVQTISDYARVIKQKNAILSKSEDEGRPLKKVTEQLEPWNEQLAIHGSRIHRSRLRYVERLNDALERRLFGSELVQLRYASSLEGKGDLSAYDELIATRLNVRVQAELAAGYSLVGPHRDDLEILLDGADIRKYGSAGQQRSTFLLIQIANISIYHSQNFEYPLFLLDEIDSELDYDRVGSLMEFLKGKTQTFVTTSKENFVTAFGSDAAVFDIADGNANPR